MRCVFVSILKFPFVPRDHSYKDRSDNKIMMTENLISSINTMFIRKDRHYLHNTPLKISPGL